MPDLLALSAVGLWLAYTRSGGAVLGRAAAAALRMHRAAARTLLSLLNADPT